MEAWKEIAEDSIVKEFLGALLRMSIQLQLGQILELLAGGRGGSPQGGPICE